MLPYWTRPTAGWWPRSSGPGRCPDRRRLRAGWAIPAQRGPARDLAGMGRYLLIGRRHCCGCSGCERALPEPAGGGVKPQDGEGAGMSGGRAGAGGAEGGPGSTGGVERVTGGGLGAAGGRAGRPKPAFWVRQPQLGAMRAKNPRNHNQKADPHPKRASLGRRGPTEGRRPGPRPHPSLPASVRGLRRPLGTTGGRRLGCRRVRAAGLVQTQPHQRCSR